MFNSEFVGSHILHSNNYDIYRYMDQKHVLSGTMFNSEFIGSHILHSNNYDIYRYMDQKHGHRQRI